MLDSVPASFTVPDRSGSLKPPNSFSKPRFGTPMLDVRLVDAIYLRGAMLKDLIDAGSLINMYV